jgi:uncharacterized protein YycO
MVSPIKSKLQAGDVVLTKTSGEFSNLIIPGQYKHAGMYVGDGKIVESIGSGVREISLEEFLTTKDYAGVFRPIFADGYHMALAAQWAKSQVGKPYDYEFSSENESFYCFELSYSAYREAMGDNSKWELRSFLGLKTVVADDFIKAKSKWREVLYL